jgi:hypothetical protein
MRVLDVLDCSSAEMLRRNSLLYAVIAACTVHSAVAHTCQFKAASAHTTVKSLFK